METSEDLLKIALARVDALESRNAMRDLISDYCHGFDKHDYKRFLGIWWEDCVWDVGPPFGKFDGHDGIHRAVHDVLWPAWRETHHLTTNFTVSFDDLDHANGLSDVDCMGASTANVFLVVGATYTDAFERRGGVWKISKRKVQIHYFNPIPGAEMTAP